MAGRGPAPKDPSTRRRRNVQPEAVVLPAEGRQGPAPAWPITTQPEPSCWAGLWLLPQAVMWTGFERQIASYALLLERAESGAASMALFAEIRLIEDRFGLSPRSMLSLRWTIAPTDDRSTASTRRPSRSAGDPRERLRVV